jgi:hypothetical protein
MRHTVRTEDALRSHRFSYVLFVQVVQRRDDTFAFRTHEGCLLVRGAVVDDVGSPSLFLVFITVKKKAEARL